MKHIKKGFTLIELLVVIAIISLLASVVLASLSSARAKAADASVKETLSNVRTQAEIYYSTNNNYGLSSLSCSDTSAIFGDSRINALIVAAESRSGAAALCASASGLGGGVDYPSPLPAVAWRVKVPLRAAAANNYWCVDSSGASKQIVQVFDDGVPVCP